MIGHPLIILRERVSDIMWKEFSRRMLTINNFEEIIKRIKERVKNELDRDIIVDFPNKNRLEICRFSLGDSLSWTKDSTIRIVPKEEDEEIQELFHTFPIEVY